MSVVGVVSAGGVVPVGAGVVSSTAPAYVERLVVSIVQVLSSWAGVGTSNEPFQLNNSSLVAIIFN